MTHRIDAWIGCVVVSLVACAPLDNGGQEISFGPVTVSATAPGTIGDATQDASESGDSSSTGEESPDDTSGPPPTTDPSTDAVTDSAESSDGSDSSSDDGSSTGGDAPALDCTGLDEATCGVTLGCGWPTDDFFGMGAGPCGWDPAACPGFDQLTCAASPACVFLVGKQVCTAVTCDVLDELVCPTVAGCFWFADEGGGGICFGSGFG